MSTISYKWVLPSGEITPSAVRNVIALLWSIDRHELESAGLTMTEAQWTAFRDGPDKFFLRTNDTGREIITKVMNERMQKRDISSAEDRCQS